jgi:hypothetical protein
MKKINKPTQKRDMAFIPLPLGIQMILQHLIRSKYTTICCNWIEGYFDYKKAG